MTEREWNELDEMDQFAIHLGLTVWVGVIELHKLAKRRKSVLVKEDKKWILSFYPRFIFRHEQEGEEILKAWNIVRKYAEYLPISITKDICQIQSNLRQMKKEI